MLQFLVPVWGGGTQGTENLKGPWKDSENHAFQWDILPT